MTCGWSLLLISVGEDKIRPWSFSLPPRVVRSPSPGKSARRERQLKPKRRPVSLESTMVESMVGT